MVGTDLVKDPSVLVRAYDDSAGVTAAFNLNVLRRLNSEMGANFDLDQFAHRADLESAGQPHRDASRKPAQTERDDGGRDARVRGRRAHRHRALSQVHRVRVCGVRPLAPAGKPTRTGWMTGATSASITSTPAEALTYPALAGSGEKYFFPEPESRSHRVHDCTRPRTPEEGDPHHSRLSQAGRPVQGHHHAARRRRGVPAHRG